MTTSAYAALATVGDINAFVEALGLVIKGVSTKSTLPILGFIRLDAPSATRASSLPRKAAISW